MLFALSATDAASDFTHRLHNDIRRHDVYGVCLNADWTALHLPKLPELRLSPPFETY